MAKTIEITIDKAKKAYNNANKEGKNLLADLLGKEFISTDITDQLDTFEDVLAYNNLTQARFDKMHGDKSPDSYAYEQIKLLVLTLNEGTVLSLYDIGYYPWFKKVDSGRGLALGVVICDVSDAYVAPRLWYKNEKLARFAGTKFEHLYVAFFTK